MKAEATSIWTQSENYYNCLTLRWSLRSRTSSEPQCSRGRAARVCEGRRRARRAQPAPGALNGPPAQRQCPDKTHTHSCVRGPCHFQNIIHPRGECGHHLTNITSQTPHDMKVCTGHFRDKKTINVFMQLNWRCSKNTISKILARKEIY